MPVKSKKKKCGRPFSSGVYIIDELASALLPRGLSPNGSNIIIIVYIKVIIQGSRGHAPMPTS